MQLDHSKFRMAPDFELKDSDGQVVRLSDYRGKVVALDFWTTWCGPCNVEIPWLNDLEHKYKDQGVSVLGVSLDDGGWKVVKPFLAAHNVNYRVMLADVQTPSLYGVGRELPTIFLIDRDGKLVGAYQGVVNRKEFEIQLEQLASDRALP